MFTRYCDTKRWFVHHACLAIVELQSTPMHRSVLSALAVSAILILPASGEPLSISPNQLADQPPTRNAALEQPTLGGGFIQFVFGGGIRPAGGSPLAPASYAGREPDYGYGPPDAGASAAMEEQPEIDPRYRKQRVSYRGPEQAGTIVIDTRDRFLYLIEDGGSALRYGVGVGRPGFGWSGVKQVSMKRTWPDWRPPDEMLKRRPDLPSFMAGGPENPLGARALYLGSSLYRIHGSNEPWTIGTEVSSGCIRMRNEDVIDLYDRVRVGAKVVVL
jgi:lipoprotein-anchoring transpeptidase ErfK/SrfK